MEIKTKIIEETAPIQLNNAPTIKSSPLNTVHSTDFESYLKNSDENKKVDDDQKFIQNNLNQPNPAASQQIQSQDKKAEATKDSKKLPEKDKEKIPVKINNIEDIRLFLHTKELSDPHQGTRIDLDHLKKEDIDFLKTCLENPSVTFNTQNLQADFAVQNQNGQISYVSANVSKTLFNLMEYSFKAQKPVRLDFNGNSSVILKMNNNGKLIAEFISNDKAMEYALKSSIPYLKDKLDSEGIDYEEISYKDNSRNRNKKQNNEGGNQ